MVKKIEDKNFIAPVNLEEQEHLSVNRLSALEASVQDALLQSSLESSRPKESFIDLMNWVMDNFRDHLKDVKNINKFVHNRIIMDGQFLRFCEENKITFKPLYKDSIVSWKTENNYEKFFAQGVFLIEGMGTEFIHSALFHKGNQNEDEISFFNLVAQSKYAKYLELRNAFDAWVVQRDRSNLHIRVVDGEDMPYTRDQSWDNLFLPTTIKNDVKQLVENFLDNKDFYAANNIPWKRGVLMFGEPGNGKTSIIRTIISNYNFKPVTIVPGANDEAVREAFAYAEEQSPSLLYFEDLDSLLEKTIDTSSFLNLMDGISAKNGLLIIATANDVSKLKTNITDRPSRFDRKFEIPLPDVEMSFLYLKKWFGSLVTVAKVRELAKYAVKYKFSYAYLKELYVSSMFEALANNRKVPTEKDISKALDRLMKDKNILRSGRSVNTEKYFSK
jgi:hypothetical protein